VIPNSNDSSFRPVLGDFSILVEEVQAIIKGNCLRVFVSRELKKKVIHFAAEILSAHDHPRGPSSRPLTVFSLTDNK